MQADTVAGLAVLGKTGAALALILAILALGAWLARRFQLQRKLPRRPLRLVSSTAVGQRERVVVVEIENTWLVLGVGGGHVSRLHELPAPPAPSHPPAAGAEA